VVALVGAVAWAGGEKLSGYAEFREGAYLIADGQRIRVNEKTRIKGARNYRTIRMGSEIQVKGTRQDDGSILARKIQVGRNLETSLDRELEQGFDQIERQYLELGRMATTNHKGKVIEDFGELIEDGPQVARVRRIMTRVIPPYVDPDRVRVYVVDNDEWNAMAAPNYSVWVFSGLLEDLDDDEVALVLGHELAHATHEHSRKQLQRTNWVQLGAVAAATVAGEAIESDTGAMAAQTGAVLGASAASAGYSREHEDQADRVGLRYAYEAGYDVTKGAELWQRFARKYGESSVAVNFFFGDHSRSSKRAALLQQQIHYNYPPP